MKVLLVAPSSVIHSRRYAELLLKNGCAITLLDHAKADRRKIAGVRVRRWPAGGQAVLQRCFGAGPGRKISEACVRLALKNQWWASGADICHVQWIDDRAWQIARAGLQPLVLTAWGSDLNWLDQPGGSGETRERIGFALRHARLLIVDSTDILALAERLAGQPVPSLLLPIGIDTRMFKPELTAPASALRRELGIHASAQVFFSPRALSRRYGHESILRAFCQLASDPVCDAYLLLKQYGVQNDGLVPQLKEIAQKAGVAERVKFLPEMPYARLPELYSAADVAVNFPDEDAFPVTFLESLACGTPMVTKHLPAYDTYPIRRHLHFTAEPTDTGLARAMHRALAAKSDRAQLAQARQEVVDQFDEATIGKRLVESYRKILATPVTD